MSVPILSTKLYIPPNRPSLLTRPRMQQKLQKAETFPLTLISASAGSGKTTLLSEWVTTHNNLCAWISLDKGDNDPARFIHYFFAALDGIHPEKGTFKLEQPPEEPFESVLITLINLISNLQNQVFLVLDDYHTISNERIHALLIFLIEHQPPNLHLVAASRIDPPWPLARYRAGGKLNEIRGFDLRFTDEEAGSFLNHIMQLDLSEKDVKALSQRTEGWIAGLQLAALSLQNSPDASAFIRDFTGSHLFVAEYLVEEILSRLPEQTQNFLFKTSILSRLNAGLCEAVSGCEDAQLILTTLQRENTFLIPLDHEGVWFRYHHLFADLLKARLQQTLSKDGVKTLHLMAAKWFEQHDQLDEAIQHAFAAEDTQTAADLIDRAGLKMITSDRYFGLTAWLDELPAEVFKAHPRLEVYQLLINLSRGTMDMYEQTLLEKEQVIRSLPQNPENRELIRKAMVNLSLFLAHQNTGLAIRMAREAMKETGEDDFQVRASLYSVFYRAHGMDGDYEQATRAYYECFRLGMESRQFNMVSNTTMVRAFDLCQYGKLDEAETNCLKIIKAGSNTGQDPFYPGGAAYIALGGLYLERNDLNQAEKYLEQGLSLCHQGALYGLYTGYIQQARLFLARGALDRALLTLSELERKLKRRDFTLTALQTVTRLAAGDIHAAAGLITEIRDILGESRYSSQLPLIAEEAFTTSLARIYTAQGQTVEALQLVDAIQPGVEADGRYGRLIELHCIRVLAYLKQNQPANLVGILTQIDAALSLAVRFGFFRLLAESGPGLVPAIKAYLGQGNTDPEVDRLACSLINVLAPDALTGQSVSGSADLIEPLTPREMDVLVLLADGDSNKQIAAKLVITVRTVKKHTSNILAKLQAENRTQAVAIARNKGLIS